MTIDKLSWGYRRNARIDEYLTVQEIIALLATMISCGGNLLLDIGPTNDGRVIPIFQERLAQIGQYVETNAEAIYKTRPWIYQNDTVNPNVWYVSTLTDESVQDPRRIYNPQIATNTVVYAHVLKWPQDGLLLLGAPQGTKETKVSMLGYSGEIKFKPLSKGGLSISLSNIPWLELPNQWSWVFKIENLAKDDRIPNLYDAQRFVDETANKHYRAKKAEFIETEL